MTSGIILRQGPKLSMNTWSQVQKYIDKHDLPYSIIRFNMSNRGCLVDTFTREPIAYTVAVAEEVIKFR